MGGIKLSTHPAADSGAALLACIAFMRLGKLAVVLFLHRNVQLTVDTPHDTLGILSQAFLRDDQIARLREHPLELGQTLGLIHMDTRKLVEVALQVTGPVEISRDPVLIHKMRLGLATDGHILVHPMPRYEHVDRLSDPEQKQHVWIEFIHYLQRLHHENISRKFTSVDEPILVVCFDDLTFMRK